MNADDLQKEFERRPRLWRPGLMALAHRPRRAGGGDAD
jgi:hypothetical protein